MKIAVIGAGAVGGYFGARWQQAGVDVTFVVREGRKRQLETTGLVIQSPLGDVRMTPKLAMSAAEAGDCDLVLLAVKNYHLEAALDTIKALTDRGAYVLPLLNGVEHFARLKEVCGDDRVLGGVVQIIVTLNEEGHVVHSNRLHDIQFGPLDRNQTAFCEKLEQVTEPANMVLRLSTDVEVDIWNKYAFITAFSGITAASRLSIDEVLKVPETVTVFRKLLAEMQELAAAHGVHLREDFVDRIHEWAAAMPAGATSSMHQDLRKGLPLEVDSLQGAAVRLAGAKGSGVPTVTVVHGLLQPYAAGN